MGYKLDLLLYPMLCPSSFFVPRLYTLFFCIRYFPVILPFHYGLLPLVFRTYILSLSSLADMFIHNFSIHDSQSCLHDFPSNFVPIALCSIEGNFPNLTLYFAGEAVMTLGPSSYLYKQMLNVCLTANSISLMSS